jgi:hypothetical protein
MSETETGTENRKQTIDRLARALHTLWCIDTAPCSYGIDDRDQATELLAALENAGLELRQT